MRVILFQSVDNLGAAGEVVNVKPGYFRNYLGPRGYARQATKANLALIESQRKKIEAMVAREREAAKAAAGDLNGVHLVFELRANDKGQLFGSVTTQEIARLLAEKGYTVDRRKIELSDPIKSVGENAVRIRLYPEVYAEITVEVKRFLRPEEIEAIEEMERKKAEALEAAAAGDSEDLEAEAGDDDDFAVDDDEDEQEA